MWINEDCQRWQVSLVCLSLCLSVSFFLFCVCVSLCLGCRLLQSVSCFSFLLFLIRILSFLSFTINFILIFPEEQKNKHRLSFFPALRFLDFSPLLQPQLSLYLSLSLSIIEHHIHCVYFNWHHSLDTAKHQFFNRIQYLSLHATSLKYILSLLVLRYGTISK